MPSRGRRRLFSALLVLPWLVLLAAAVAFLRVWREDARPLPVFDTGATEQSWNGDRFVVVNRHVGWSPRRNVVRRMRIGPVEGPRERHERAQNNLGLIRSGDVNELPDARRVLLVGDSHMEGVVRNDANASSVLEQGLRQRSGDPEAVVYNGSCGNYSLYQYVLRARELFGRLRPDTLVVVVFLGNDLLELEHLGRPHLDDGGVERPAIRDPVRETATWRLAALDLTLRQQGLFWQGLNQASYFREFPRRVSPMLLKVRRSLELLKELADAHEMRLIVAVLPSYDLVFPETVRAVNAPVRELMERNVNVNLRAALFAALTELGIEPVDLLERFRSAHAPGLFADDYHIYVGGHRLVAEALLEPVLAAAP